MSEVKRIEQTETGYAWFFERTVSHMRKVDQGGKYPGEDAGTEKGGLSGHEPTKGEAETSLDAAIKKLREKLP